MKFFAVIVLLAVFCIAAPMPTDDDPDKAVENYKKLLKMIAKPQSFGLIKNPTIIKSYPTLKPLLIKIDAIWGKGKAKFGVSKFSIPFPLQLIRDQKKVLRMKVLGLQRSQNGQPFSKVGNKLESWPSLSLINIGVGEGFEITSLQIVPLTVAPTTKTPTKAPTSPTSSPSSPTFYFPPSCAPYGRAENYVPGSDYDCRPVEERCKCPSDKGFGCHAYCFHLSQIPKPRPSGCRSVGCGYWNPCTSVCSASVNGSVVPTVTTDIPFISSANFLVIGVASLIPFFLTFF